MHQITIGKRELRVLKYLLSTVGNGGHVAPLNAKDREAMQTLYRRLTWTDNDN